MTIEQKAEERYPTELRGKELPNTIEHERYVYIQKAKQAAYLAGAAEQSEEVERLKKENEEMKEVIKQIHNESQHNIPYYGYSENEAACAMDNVLNKIFYFTEQYLKTLIGTGNTKQ